MLISSRMWLADACEVSTRNFPTSTDAYQGASVRKCDGDKDRVQCESARLPNHIKIAVLIWKLVFRVLNRIVEAILNGLPIHVARKTIGSRDVLVAMARPKIYGDSAPGTSPNGDAANHVHSIIVAPSMVFGGFMFSLRRITVGIFEIRRSLL
jgi:hypothetical protein